MILLHESAHYIKRYGAENDILSNVVTEPEFTEELISEGGKIFINYLFNHKCIEVISLEQGTALFEEETWTSISILHNVFKMILPQKTTDTISYMYIDNDNSGCLSYPKYCYPH